MLFSPPTYLICSNAYWQEPIRREMSSRTIYFDAYAADLAAFTVSRRDFGVGRHFFRLLFSTAFSRFASALKPRGSSARTIVNVLTALRNRRCDDSARRSRRLACCRLPPSGLAAMASPCCAASQVVATKSTSIVSSGEALGPDSSAFSSLS